MPANNKKIWVLTDHRPGNNNQCLALAQELGLKYEIIDVKHSFLSKLPNFILSSSLFRISKKSRQELAYRIKSQGYPQLIIAAGRRLATTSLLLKTKSQNYSKIIQIMKPQLPISDFDLVILPKHDNVKNKEKGNIVFSIGALNAINEKNLQLEAKKFNKIFSKFKTHKIALILGGNSRGYKISDNSILKLANKINNFAKKNKFTLLIANSRRTNQKTSELLLQHLKCNFKFFDWQQYQGHNNPYKAILANSDQFILSSDSISMISECCSTSKAVFIFDHDKAPSKKHHKFLEFMLRNQYVKKFDFSKNYLKEFTPKKLHETQRIALIIKRRFLKN